MVASRLVRPLRVAIFYTDLAAADRALRAVREALHQRQDARPFEPVLWPAQFLEQAHWLRFAVSDVGASDLCVLSLGSGDPRANDAAAWLRELAPEIARHWITVTADEPAVAVELVSQAV